MPDDKRARFIAAGLSPYDASVLAAERELADYYEELARGVDAKAAANWLNNEVLGRLNRDGALHQRSAGEGGREQRQSSR